MSESTAAIETTTAGKGISESMKAKIVREYEQSMFAASQAVWHAVRCGRLLAEAKAQADHGSWLPLLDEIFPGSQRTAQGYMRLAAHAGDDESAYAQALAHLGIEGALKAIAAPKALPRASDQTQEEAQHQHGDEHLHHHDGREDGDARPPQSEWHRVRGAKACARIYKAVGSLHVFAEGELAHEDLLAQLELALTHSSSEDRANWLEQCDGTIAVLNRVRTQVRQAEERAA